MRILLHADTAQFGYCSIGLAVKGKDSMTIDL
jgi:hypothetical protein